MLPKSTTAPACEAGARKGRSNDSNRCEADVREGQADDCLGPDAVFQVVAANFRFAPESDIACKSVKASTYPRVRYS